MDSKQIIIAYLFLFGLTGAANLAFIIAEKKKIENVNIQGSYKYIY